MTPPPLWTKTRDGLALAFAMTFPTLMAWAYFIALAASPGEANPGEDPNPALQLAYSLGKLVQFSFPVIYLGVYDRRWLRPGLPNFRGLAYGIGFGLLVAAAMLALYHFVLRDGLLHLGTADRVRDKVREFGAASPSRFMLLAGFILLIHSFLEEYYWRWFVFGRLQLLVQRGSAVALSSLAFMAHHVVVLHVYLPGRFLEAVVPFSLCIAVGGAFWAWLYDRTGSLYSPWLSHILIDTAIMAIGYHLLFA